MGRRGPLPASPELQRLSGRRPGPDAAAPAADAGRPVRPAYLDGDPVACAEWGRIVAQIVEAGIPCGSWNSQALGIYCDAYSRWRAASDLVAAEGLTAETTRGGIQPHPGLKIAQQASATMFRLLREFGLTPGSRTAPPPPPPPPDDFDEFIARGRELRAKRPE